MKRPPQTHATPTGFSWASSGNEELVYPLVRRGALRIDERGRVWRHMRGAHRGKAGGRKLERLSEPRRADIDRSARRDGGPTVALRVTAHVGGRQVLCMAARLVWMHWHGPIPHGMRIAHIDGNQQNNAPENLVMERQSRVVRRTDERLPERRPRGVRHGRAKLTEERVREIRRRAAAGETYTALAAEMGLSIPGVRFAATGKTWAHISEEKFTAEDAETRRKARGVRA